MAAALCAALVLACTPAQDANNEYADADPAEALNRQIFAFNRVVDTIVLRPVAAGYREVMPARGKIMVSNFVSNVKEPVTFANSVLQLDARNSFATFWRFLINSSFGIGGLFDVATEIGLENRETGLGDTFSIYGANSGPYFVIPIIGPSTTRDSLGRLGDVFLDPISYTNNAIVYSVIGVKTVDTRYHKLKLLDDVYNNSVDPYATLRSLFLQYRTEEVKRAKNKRNASIEKTNKENAGK